MKLLLIEDEQDLAGAIVSGLRKHGYAVDVAYDGVDGSDFLAANQYDLLILDLNLPDIDGLELCRRARRRQPGLLILILTARTLPEQRAVGLDSGADDYLCKPFVWCELLARLRALLRRELRSCTTMLECGELSLDTAACTALLGGRPISLTPKEFAILEYLMLHPGQVLCAQELIEHAWDASANMLTNSVCVHINALRRKLKDDAQDPLYIETVVGKGYRLRPGPPGEAGVEDP